MLLLSSCSALRIVYNQLPDMTYWWLDSYVDLNDEQSVQLRRDLANLYQWQRTQRLKAYADSLARLRQLASANLTEEQACTVGQDMRAHLQELPAQVDLVAANLARSLSQDQLQHLQRQLDKRDDEWRREWLQISAAEQRKKRLTTAIERSEMFYGRLDDTQRALLRSAVEQSSLSAATQWADRQRRQTEMQQALQNIVSERPSIESTRQIVRGLMERAMTPTLALHRNYFEQQWQEGCRTAARLQNTTSAAQRQQAISTLQGYEDDLRLLAQQKP